MMLNFPGIPYDLRNASPRRGGALERLRSATFLTNGLTVVERRAFLNECKDWIGNYNNWFLQMVGIHDGVGLHLLYDREIMITGENLLDCLLEIESVGKIARGYGFAFSISVLGECLHSRLSEILSLADGKIVSAIAVTINHEEKSPDKLRTALEAIVAHGLNVGVIGEIKNIRKIELFGNEKISSADMTWYPLVAEGIARNPPNPIRACHSRLRIYIDSRGDIYPCLGMVGFEDGALGNIRDPIVSTGLCESPVLDLLDVWEVSGPRIVEKSEQSNDEDMGLPEICRRHRAHLR